VKTLTVGEAQGQLAELIAEAHQGACSLAAACTAISEAKKIRSPQATMVRCGHCGAQARADDYENI
jgi:hypothetical protein